MTPKAGLGAFLARNPFPRGWTDGLFYREKMRAIHRVAPNHASGAILEVGGGQSGLAARLYPGAPVVTLDIDPALAKRQPEDSPSTFVCGDARKLPFPDDSFAIVTMFDLLEHVDDHQAAATEALRVARPGGHLLVSTPAADWHYPYYSFMRPVCPDERDLMTEWGHVRRGYREAELVALFGTSPDASATFINPLTAFFHDVAFSRLSLGSRHLLYLLASPVVLPAYKLHRRSTRGTETAFAWRV